MNNSYKNIINNIADNFATDSKLISLTWHGSCNKDNIEEKNYIDFDILFVYRKEGLKIGIDSVSNYFKLLCEKDNDDIVFLFSLKSGPMHPLKKNGELIDLSEKKFVFFISLFLAMKYTGVKIPILLQVNC